MTPRWKEARRVGRRVLVTGELRLTAPCHLGGPDPDATSERPVLRDATGRPYLPGTTLAGLLRGALADGDARALFGHDCDGAGVQSPLIVDDAPVMAAVPTELRDGVRIDGATGIAGDKTKFDVELLPVGTRFALHFEIVLPGEGGDASILSSFVRLLQSLEDGEVRLGARTRRGLGACAVPAGLSRWHVEDLDVSRRDGLLAWLGRGRDLGASWPRVEPRSCSSARDVAATLGCSLPEATPGRTLRVNVTLEIAGSLILRSGGHDPADADSIHLHRLDVDGRGARRRQPVIPGTSLAGVLRHRCLRIAQTLERERERGRQLVDGMFGDVTRASRGDVTRASRVRVPEAPLLGGKLLRHTRLRIDPWTGGALESFLFTEDAWYGGSVALTIELAPHGDDERAGAERALLLLALRDLATGDLSVGGESGAGRGRLRPPASGEFAETVGPRGTATLTLVDDGRVEVRPPTAFAEDFEALHTTLVRGGAR